jgi:acyl carrier protein
MKISIKKYIRTKIIKIISTISGLDNDHVIKNLDTDFNIILNNDYLDFVEIVMLLEEEFNVEIDETLTEEINTPNKIIKCVLNKLKC